MTLDEYNKFFLHIGSRLSWLGVTGGEPFLRDDLPEIIKSASRHARNLFLISINTNGLSTSRILRTTETILKETPRLNLVVITSLDGPPEVHNITRGIRNAHAHALETVTGLRELARQNPHLTIHTETIVSHLNVHILESFSRRPPVPGVPHMFAFALEGTRYENVGEGVALQQKDFERIKHLLPLLASRGHLHGATRLVLDQFYRLASCFYRHPRRQVIPCFSSFASAYVGARGEVRPCILMDPIGNLREHNYCIEAILQSVKGRKSREMILHEQCPNCWTPCEAVCTLLHNPHKAVLRSMIFG